MTDGDKTSIPHTSPFDAIRHSDERGNEYWSARELGRILGYQTNYRNFQRAIAKAQKACEESGYKASDHFAHVRNMITVGKGGQREVEDIHLSRYGAYLSVQNSDPEKPIVALGQTYFAVQTRRQELAEQLAALPDDQRRLIYRSEITIWNQQLNEAAKQAGVISPADFAIFTDHGYSGLYGGLRENDIHARKGLVSSKQKILIWVARSWQIIFFVQLRRMPDYAANRLRINAWLTRHISKLAARFARLLRI